MAKVWKLWLYLEECDEEKDEYTDIDGPICLGTHETEAEAEEEFEKLGMQFEAFTEDEVESRGLADDDD